MKTEEILKLSPVNISEIICRCFDYGLTYARLERSGFSKIHLIFSNMPILGINEKPWGLYKDTFNINLHIVIPNNNFYLNSKYCDRNLKFHDLDRDSYSEFEKLFTEEPCDFQKFTDKLNSIFIRNKEDEYRRFFDGGYYLDKIQEIMII